MESKTGRSSAARRRRRRIVLTILAVTVIVVGLLVWLVITGGKPLKDGATLADGRVTTVVSQGFIAAYLVELEDQLALVDATLDPAAADIRRHIDRMGRKASDVKAIFLTHGHGDHIAGARAFPQAEIYALAADADLVAGERTAENLPGRFREPQSTGIVVDHPLSGSEILEVGGTRIEVFPVPGHTRGSAAFLIHGVLFMGDAAGASSEDTLAVAPPVFSWDRERARESLHRLAQWLAPRRSEVRAMAFGHQGPLRGLDPLLEWHRGQQ